MQSWQNNSESERPSDILTWKELETHACSLRHVDGKDLSDFDRYCIRTVLQAELDVHE